MNIKLISFVACAAVVAAAFGFTRSHESSPAPGSKGSVLFVLSTECPACGKYTPRINRLVQEFEAKGIAFSAIMPNEGETLDGVRHYFQERHYSFEFRLDAGAVEAKKHGVEIVPSAIVFDARGTKVYQGAIDDNLTTDNVKKTYLADVLRKLEAGISLKFRSIPPKGCYIMPGIAKDPVVVATFASHVAPILYKHCTPCHRPGEAAPFSLTNYDEARKWAKNIAKVTASKSMPPWKAVKGFGEFNDENRLTDEEIQTLQTWANNDAPRGDAGSEPKAPVFKSGWVMGEPDLVVTPSGPFKVPAEGRDVYRHFVIKTNMKEPVYVTALDVKPGNRKVVHHVIAFLDDKGVATKLEGKDKDGQPGYSGFGGPGFMPDGALGGWAPGLQPRNLPAGAGIEIQPGANIVLQIHYHLDGKEEVDQTKVGLYFSKVPVDKKVKIAWIANPFFKLKAGESHQVVKFTYPIMANVIAYGVMPHMHMLGRSMKATLLLPDGTTKPMVWVDDWDFNWQMTYTFKEPLHIPKGSKIQVEAVYDNSTNNPNQPNNPPRDVTWGEQTTDEMFLLVCGFALDQ